MRLISKQAFRQYMEFRDETNVSLGQKAGVSKAIVGHLRGGQRDTCSPATARKIEKALNAPPGSLFVAGLPHTARGMKQSA